LRSGDRIEREFRDEFLPMYLDEARPQSVADFDKLETQDLCVKLRESAIGLSSTRMWRRCRQYRGELLSRFAPGGPWRRRAWSRHRCSVRSLRPSKVSNRLGVAALPKSRPWLLARHFVIVRARL